MKKSALKIGGGLFCKVKILFHHIFHHLKEQTGTKKIFALPLNEKEKFPESTGNKALSGNFSLAAGEGFEPSQTESESVRKKTQSSCRSMYSSN